jgi:choice-of-anchor C domain-containing protein
MNLARVAARGAAIAIACISAAIAAPFQNGSFEIGTDPGSSFLTLANGDSTDITGWTVIRGNIDYIGGYWQPAQGSRSLDLIGDQFVGGVQQTFDTIPGATYSVSFEMAGNPAGGPTIRPLAVTVAGNTNNFTFDITGATLTNMNWTAHQFTFVATGTSETIQFVSDLSADPNGCCYGAALDNVQITGLPDLAIAKSHSGNFTQGQIGATYTITVANIGAGPTIGTVTVVDTLPSGLSATAISGGGWSCVLATLTCTRSDALGVGLSYPDITLMVTVANHAPAAVTNTVTVAGGGEINTGNNSASDPTTIVQVADLTIAKSHSGNFTQGQTGAAYTITVTNSGSGPTNGTVTVVDTLPSGLSATAISGGGWSCVLATLTCTRSDVLSASLSYPDITLTVTVANNAPASVTNTVTVAGGGEINTGNNFASDPTAIIQIAGLALSKTHNGNFTQGQVGATYTLTLTNTGAGPTAGAVTVTDTLPFDLTATGFSGSGWSCSLVPLSCTRSDALGAGASYAPITLTVNVATNAPSVVTNTAVATGGGAPPAPSNTANDTTQIVPAQLVHTAIPTLQNAMLALLSLCLLSLAVLRLRNLRA